MRPLRWFASLLFLLILAVPPLNARVVRIQIDSRQAVSDSKAFGNVGAYERITGRVFFSVAVTNPHNRGIVDLDKAVNLNHGEVEFSADFMALRPKDSSKGNGSLLLEVPNRGRGRIVGLIDGGDWDATQDAGGRSNALGRSFCQPPSTFGEFLCGAPVLLCAVGVDRLPEAWTPSVAEPPSDSSNGARASPEGPSPAANPFVD